MIKERLTLLNRFNGFPLYVYIAGLFLLCFGLASEIIVEKKNDLWNNPPSCWEQLKFVHPDFSSSHMQEKLKVAFESEPHKFEIINLEEFKKRARQDFPSLWPEWLKEKGINQRKSWAARMNQAALEYVTSKKRLEILEKALDNEHDGHFMTSREKFAEEKRINETLKAKLEKLKIRTAREGLVWTIIIYLLIIAIFLASSWYLYRLAKSHISPEVAVVHWKFPFWVFFLIFYLCQTGVVFYTSILKEEKSWIGASSFFVSWKAWCFERVAILGLSMIMAIPTTQLWCYLSKELIPEISPIWLRRPDGRFDVGKYVFFLQAWTLIIFGFFSVITIVVVRWAASQQAQFESAYLLNTIVSVAVAGLLIAKMIRNAIELRRRYQESLLTSFDSWSAIKNADVPADPTENFIGKSWWKLPANFVGIITATWAVLEWTGVGKVLVDALR